VYCFLFSFLFPFRLISVFLSFSFFFFFLFVVVVVFFFFSLFADRLVSDYAPTVSTPPSKRGGKGVSRSKTYDTIGSTEYARRDRVIVVGGVVFVFRFLFLLLFCCFVSLCLF
jgi:hypothetical protein